MDAENHKHYLEFGQSLNSFQRPQDSQYTERLNSFDIPALVGPTEFERSTHTQKQNKKIINFQNLGCV